MAKVDITTAGHTVIVESDDPLDVVAACTFDLWTRTRDPRLDRATATGFTPIAERSEPGWVSGHDADLSRPGRATA